MANLWAAAALILAASVPKWLQNARDACAANYKACPERDRLENEWRKEQDAKAEEELERQRETHAEALARQQEELAAEDAADAQLRKTCGRDYHRVRVGMRFERVKKCSGLVFSAVAEDKSGVVYSASGAFVRVERGVIVKWVAL